jgi:hypothetical protein
LNAGMTVPANTAVGTLGDDLVVALATAGVGALLAYGVGMRIAYAWDDRRRRREADLAALATFYATYGAFFSTWKLWAAHKRFGASVAAPTDVQWKLLERVESAESDFEALLVKLVAERALNPRDVTLLGCFREGYQTLRETIRQDKALGWWATKRTGRMPSAAWSPVDIEEGFRQYRAFKGLAAYVAVLLARTPRRSGGRAVPGRRRLIRRLRPGRSNRDERPPDAEAIGQLLEITDRERYSGQTAATQWWAIASNLLPLDTALPPAPRGGAPRPGPDR